ncbi:MAG TPA: hypothetical protein VIR79_07500 [Nitrospira sp.]
MPRTCYILAVVVILSLLGTACTTPTVQRDEAVTPAMPPPSAATEDRRVLAGEWEYEDGAVVTLTLDEQGNGTYPWKDGRFVTTTLADHTWHGQWIQKENDREGGFAVKFAPDFQEGEGRWWYSRIGTDLSPSQPGGTFHLSRKPSGMAAADPPVAP